MYLLNILKNHFKNNFDWLSVVLVFLSTSVFVVLQYQFNLISSIIKTFPHLQRIPLYVLLYGLVFSAAVTILYWRKQIPDIFTDGKFWLLSFILVLIVSFDQSYYLLALIKNLVFEHQATQAAIISVATYLLSFVNVLIPAAVLYVWLKPPSFYGLTLQKNTVIKPYWTLLWVALAIVTVGVLTSGMGSYYPVYKRSGLFLYAAELGLPNWLAIGYFEITYASNFITVELLFRGLFVFTLSKYLGKQAILPMAACYMVFHFGKPLLETISSFFGGYILGVFTYYTQNTWGGIILHIGTALFMEIMASIL